MLYTGLSILVSVAIYNVLKFTLSKDKYRECVIEDNYPLWVIILMTLLTFSIAITIGTILDQVFLFIFHLVYSKLWRS